MEDFETLNLDNWWTALSRVYWAVLAGAWSGAEGRVNCGSPAQEASEGTDISEWPRDHSCDILANVAAFLPLVLKIRGSIEECWQRRFQDSLVLTVSCGYQ